MFNFIAFLRIPLIVTILGGLSAIIGAFISIIILFLSRFINNIKNSEIVQNLYIITSGIMLGIVCFDMLPEVLADFSIFYSLFFITIGVLLVFITDFICEKKLNNNINNISISKIVLIISMAIHNFIEGIAIGASYSVSSILGFKVLLSLFLHDIPEGMVVFITDISNFKKSLKTSVLVGMITGFGVILGSIVSNISVYFISICMSLAIGAMLYVVSCDLIPNSNYSVKNKEKGIFFILGIILSFMIGML